MTIARDYQALRAAACQLVAEGRSMQDAARALDVSFSAVQAWCRRAGVRSRWPYPLPTATRLSAYRGARIRGATPDNLLQLATSCPTMQGGRGHEVRSPKNRTPRQVASSPGGTTEKV